MIPEDKLRSHTKINLASMIDFLFIMLSVFATLAVTRATLFDTQVDLAKLKKETAATSITPKCQPHQINISISQTGGYKWITDVQDYVMPELKDIQKELVHQYEAGILPKEKSQTEIFLHIDKKAPWETVAQCIFAVREVGFDAHPVYSPKDN